MFAELSVDMMRGSKEEKMLRRMLLVNCCNDEPSGGVVSKVSQLNLYGVDYALRHPGLSVAVVDAVSMDRLQAGWLLGRWSLGQKDGRLVGGICWLTDDAHAAPLTDEFFAGVKLALPIACNDITPPWDLFDVGAPKKRSMGKAASKRGAHLKRGTGCHYLDIETSGPGIDDVASGLDGNGAGVGGHGGGEPCVNVVASVPAGPLGGTIRSRNTHNAPAVDSCVPVSRGNFISRTSGSSTSGSGFKIGGREESNADSNSCEDESISVRRPGDDISH